MVQLVWVRGMSVHGAITLHHLKGYHAQSLGLGTFMSNSTRVHVINQFGTATSITGTATRSPVVRFAPRQDEPMAPLMEVQEQHHLYPHMTV